MKANPAWWVLVIAVGCTRPPAPKADPQDLETGRAAWRQGCADCHFVPDRSLAFDRVWIEMLETTTCITARAGASAEDVRRVLRAYLPTEAPPRRVDARSRASGTCGTVTTPFDRGSLYLVPLREGGPKPVRLAWERRGPLRVPTGEYHVLNYVVERSQDGRTWMLSCTGPEGPTLAVDEGKEASLAIEPQVRVTSKVKRTDSGLRVSVGLSGHGGMEASLLDVGRDAVDRRVPITFGVVDAGGREIGSGTLTYG